MKLSKFKIKSIYIDTTAYEYFKSLSDYKVLYLEFSEIHPDKLGLFIRPPSIFQNVGSTTCLIDSVVLYISGSLTSILENSDTVVTYINPDTRYASLVLQEKISDKQYFELVPI